MYIPDLVVHGRLGVNKTLKHALTSCLFVCLVLLVCLLGTDVEIVEELVGLRLVAVGLDVMGVAVTTVVTDEVFTLTLFTTVLLVVVILSVAVVSTIVVLLVTGAVVIATVLVSVDIVVAMTTSKDDFGTVLYFVWSMLSSVCLLVTSTS